MTFSPETSIPETFGVKVELCAKFTDEILVPFRKTVPLLSALTLTVITEFAQSDGKVNFVRYLTVRPRQIASPRFAEQFIQLFVPEKLPQGCCSEPR